MHRVKRVFKDAFARYPITANSVVYGSLFLGAEFSQQALTKKILADQPQPLDRGTLARFAIYGTTMQGPALTLWYQWLDKVCPGTSMRIIPKKILMDQFLFTPPLLAMFYIAMSIMERKEDPLEEFKQKIIPTFKTSCCFWPLAQLVNFLVIPPTYRVVYVGSCSLIWVNILCWLKRKEY